MDENWQEKIRCITQAKLVFFFFFLNRKQVTEAAFLGRAVMQEN